MEEKDAIVLPFVRCPTCGKVIGGLYDPFVRKIRSGKPVEDAFRELGIRRMCCRISMMNPAVLPAGLQVQTEAEVSEGFRAHSARTSEIESRTKEEPASRKIEEKQTVRYYKAI